MSRITIICGDFHKDLATEMVTQAQQVAQDNQVDVIWVPGSYEIPLVVKKLFDAKACDGVVVTGYIEKGSTLHGQEMGATCSLLLKQLELDYGIPIGMGIVGPGATLEQAQQRLDYGARAMSALLRMLDEVLPQL